mmetsp:Transcript_28106/g.49911  ORF Transcript_28106/g.49911 Transcript_28106/m.49911 type:complete len:96 (-) Transcript_28106:8-295(-)
MRGFVHSSVPYKGPLAGTVASAGRDEAMETRAPMAAGAAASRPLLVFGWTKTGDKNCQHAISASVHKHKLIKLRPRRAIAESCSCWKLCTRLQKS